jgi:hypothetical protein
MKDQAKETALQVKDKMPDKEQVKRAAYQAKE